MVNVELVRAKGSGGAGVADCVTNKVCVEGGEAVVEGSTTDLTPYLAVEVSAGRGAPREKPAKGVRYVTLRGEGAVAEGHWYVGRGPGLLPR